MPADPGDKVVAAYLHPGMVPTSFMESFDGVREFDHRHHRRLVGRIGNQAGALTIVAARNDVTAMFLDSGADWLWVVDSDMGFEPDTLERLLHSADAKERPIVGALCFGRQLLRKGLHGTKEFKTFPTVYRVWGESFVTVPDYPRQKLCRVDATGAACMVIHRSVLEKIRAEEGDTWWDQLRRPEAGWLGEDLSFCARAAAHGFPIHVDTATQTSHYKELYLTEASYDEEMARPAKHRRYVVIPVKDQLELTRNLLSQLAEQGGYDEILVFDNGSGPKMRTWLEQQNIASVFDATGASIHEMWNAGAEYAISKDPISDVVFLNNDIAIGPDFVTTLATVLRSDDRLLAVGPNYDGRTIDDTFEVVWGICANRYDGTGGMSGFAFAVRGEFFVAGYRFPTEAKWWCGDNDLVLSIYECNGLTAITRDATCEHLHGGGQTERPADWDEQIQRDMDWFRSVWDLETGKRREARIPDLTAIELTDAGARLAGER